jgi:hypothetical protein
LRKDDFELNARCGCDEYTVNSTVSIANIPSKEISVRKFIVTAVREDGG